MKLSLNRLDAEDPDGQEFTRHRSQKHRLAGRRSVNQLVSLEEHAADPFAKFTTPDLNELCREGFLDELVAGIKTGKEAAVYLGRNASGLVAVKVYTDLRVRSFKRDQAYRAGRFLGDSRIEKAIEQRSRKGLEAQQALWVQEEFRQMNYLHQHGVNVPKPIAVNGISLVMEFIGDENGTPAPRISDLKMEEEEAQEAFRQSVQNLRRIVGAGRVHGDYSTYNLLWHTGRAVVIDFPQVMEIRNNPNARAFLTRDVHALCQSFAKQGVKADEAQVLREVRKG